MAPHRWPRSGEDFSQFFRKCGGNAAVRAAKVIRSVLRRWCSRPTGPPRPSCHMRRACPPSCCKPMVRSLAACLAGSFHADAHLTNSSGATRTQRTWTTHGATAALAIAPLARVCGAQLLCWMPVRTRPLSVWQAWQARPLGPTCHTTVSYTH